MRTRTVSSPKKIKRLENEIIGNPVIKQTSFNIYNYDCYIIDNLKKIFNHDILLDNLRCSNRILTTKINFYLHSITTKVNTNHIEDVIKILDYIESKQSNNTQLISYIKYVISNKTQNKPVTEIYFNYEYEYSNKYDILLYCVLKSLL